MFGRAVAGLVTSVALLCATVAWGGWVYLHTIGDPHRVERIASSVLGDPSSRREVASALAGQLVERAGLPKENEQLVGTAVDTALGDPRITTNLIEAFAAEHARALGIDDARPTSIDMQAIVDAAREQLATVSPEVAALLPSDAVDDITLPDLHTSTAGTFRDIATTATPALAGAAVLLLVLAFALGDRRHTTRRIATWALFSGIGWVAMPYLVAAIAKQVASDLPHTIDIVRDAWVAPVRTSAIALLVVAAIAFVCWLLPIWSPPTNDAYGQPRARPVPPWATRSAARPQQYAPAPQQYAPAPQQYAPAPQQPWAPQPTAGPVDTFVRSQPQQPPTSGFPQQTQGVPAQPGGFPARTAIPDPDDPWAQYFGPGTESPRPE